MTTSCGSDTIQKRGKSLENDLNQLLDDGRFNDVTLKCLDGSEGACKAILFSRCDVFNDLISNNVNNNEIECNNIKLTAMKILLKFLYTTKIEKDELKKDIIEVYYASVYFELDILQERIIGFTKKYLEEGNKNLGKELLSLFVEKFSLDADNEMAQVLVDWVAKIKLVHTANDSLSLLGLEYLLRKTFYDEKKPFATPEFSIWEYAISKVKETVTTNSTGQNVDQDRLKPLLPYISLYRMEPNEIAKHVEPLNIFSIERVTDVYRLKSQRRDLRVSKIKELACIRGVPVFRWMLQYNANTTVNISNHGFTLEFIFKSRLFGQYSIVSKTGDIIFKGDGLYEWDIVVEKLGRNAYIGICKTDEKDDINKNDSEEYYGWVLCSDGYVYHKKDDKKVWKQFNTGFKEGDIVTVHLNMAMKQCSFSVNGGIKHSLDFSEWERIPSAVLPFVSLVQGGKLRMQPHIRK